MPMKPQTQTTEPANPTVEMEIQGVHLTLTFAQTEVKQVREQILDILQNSYEKKRLGEPTKNTDCRV